MKPYYDIVITGGGLAGLSLSILLRQKGYTVLLVEKDQYPFHRVCGEYISAESDDFLRSLGVDLAGIGATTISRLELTNATGRSIRQPLTLGGFGISRYLLDHRLSQLARSSGVDILENTKTTAISELEHFYRTDTSSGSFESRIACGSFGKRSNLDIAWQRPFIRDTRNPLSNYIGVKYHIEGDFPNDTVSLHLFHKGYAGLVRIENGIYNFCYLTAASNLRNADSSIEEMEKNVLSRNPAIRKILQRSRKLSHRPVTISQISFASKSRVEQGMLMLGDAAGLIAPLCGNGMSMALHSSKIAAGLLDRYLSVDLGKAEMGKAYSREWAHHFSSRMRMGRVLQSVLARPVLAGGLLTIGTIFPGMVRQLIRKTHGESF